MKMLTPTTGKEDKKPKYKKLLNEIKTELEHVERRLLAMDCRCDSMRTDLGRVITSGGKRLRPILAYLCYRLGGSEAYPILPLLTMLELMHTASLIHDDVVDGAELRRGTATINATSGVEAAVQSGDFLLAEAMENLHIYKATGINEALIQSSSDMCLGELQQLTVRHNLTNQTRQQYFFQIYRKTASLIATSCLAGGIAGGMPESKAKMLKVYGENLGIAFQLCDDLLDFSDQPGFGKAPGQDIQNGIFTLPVLYLLEEGIPSSVKALFQKKNKELCDIRRLIDYVKTTKALSYTNSMIRQKTDEAVDALRDFPEGVEKTALTVLAAQLVDRDI
jgi:geranylgeranyl pyrophosphate synthase